jgi:AcrR family transcriptional regulator
MGLRTGFQMINGVTLPLTKRGLITFDALARAGESLFHTKGYHLTTINDICDKAGVASGTFYLYFSDKYSLYRRLLLDYSHKIRLAIATAVKDLPSRIEQERVGIATFIKFARDNPHSYTIIWQSLQVDKDLFIDYYSSFAKSYNDGLIQSANRGEIKKIDTMTMAYALMGISNFVGLQVIMFEKGLVNDADIDRIVDQVIQMLQNGLFS